MTKPKQMPAAELRRKVALAASIMSDARVKRLAQAEEAKKRSTAFGDAAYITACEYEYLAMGYELALHALWISTQGEFGSDLDRSDEASAAMS